MTKTKKPGRRGSSKDICGATASGGVFVCVRERGHAKDHCTSSDRKPVQHATWTTGADGRLAVKAFSHGKQVGEWTEEPAPEVCGSAVTDAFGKVAKGPFAKACERAPGHDGPHSTAPHGDLEFVTEWEDGRAGSVSYNRKAQRGEEDSDGEDDPFEDEVRSDEDRAFARQQREAREAHAAELEREEHEAPIADRDPKPENMIEPTGETITCAGRVYAVHPMARIFPTPEKQYREVVESMRREGQIRDVELLDEPGNPVIDGCTRLRACEELGIAPRTKIIHVDDKLAYVKAANLHRRHLDESQRAMTAASLATLEHGANQYRGAAPVPVLTQAQAAAAMGVSERIVREAVRVRNAGTPEVQAAVREGRLKVKAAAALVELDPKEQRELVEQVTKGEGEVRAGKVRSLVKQRQRREVVERINRDLVAPMPIGPFGVILVDYPWPYENSDAHEGSRGHITYPPMSIPEILSHAREASKRAGDDCVLALWITNAFWPQYGAIVEAWGFTHRTVITWTKDRVGVGTWPRGKTEHLCILSKGSPTHTLNEITTEVPAPLGEHSEKPEVFRELLEKHCAGPFLELFTRRARKGWSSWGAEVQSPPSDETPKVEPKKRSKIFTKTDEAVRAP